MNRRTVGISCDSGYEDGHRASRLIGHNMPDYRHQRKDGVGSGVVLVIDIVKGVSPTAMFIRCNLLTGGCIQTWSC